MVLVYIHGANATPASFNFIRQHIGDGLLLSYDSNMGFKNNLARLTAELENKHNIVFIAHSLGGIYALHLANAMPDRVTRAITISTPYGGHCLADYAKLFLPFHTLLHDIGPNSWPVASAQNIEIKWPWTNAVSIKGNAPWMSEENDGVVTIASQRHRTDIELIDVDSNHYEIVLNQRVVDIIEDRLL